MCGPRPKRTPPPVPDHRFGKRCAFALGSLFKPCKRAADVSLLSWEGSESAATVCELPNITVVRAASLGVNVRLALTALQNGSPGSRPLRALTSRRCRHNLSFPAVSTCPLFTLHHFYFLPVFSSTSRPPFFSDFPCYACTLPGLTLLI